MSNLISIIDNKPTTTSLQVAKYFGKNHDQVLKNIRSLQSKNSLVYFDECFYTADNGQSYPMFRMDKDNFTLLAMSFTGQKAIGFKIEYIQAFNAMERQLTQPKKLTTLEMLKEAVSEIERLETELTTTNLELEHKQSIIVDLADKVPPKTMRAKINEIVKSYASNNHLQHSYVWNSLYKQFKYTYSIDLDIRAKNSKQSKLDEAEKANKLEELYLLTLKMYESAKN